jgi:hypothetical protein
VAQLEERRDGKGVCLALLLGWLHEGEHTSGLKPLLFANFMRPEAKASGYPICGSLGYPICGWDRVPGGRMCCKCNVLWIFWRKVCIHRGAGRICIGRTDKLRWNRAAVDDLA